MNERDDRMDMVGIVLVLLILTWMALIGITSIQDADIRDLQRRIGQVESK